MIIQNEIGICKTVDPWGGSYYIESLTDELIKKAKIHLDDEIKLQLQHEKGNRKGIPK